MDGYVTNAAEEQSQLVKVAVVGLLCFFLQAAAAGGLAGSGGRGSERPRDGKRMRLPA